MRLEVHHSNRAAIARYRKSGYAEFGRHHDYYEDGADALRFEKRLVPRGALASAPPYFHQSTEFTCGPACIMMALAWADRSFRAAPAFEFQLWREATTIFTGSAPGGCEPYGMAVALRRHGLRPELYVSGPGPYFLETVTSTDRRRVMRLTQGQFQREARTLDIPSHLTPVSELVPDAGVRRRTRGHRAGFGLSHGSQREAALDFCIRPRRAARAHARPGGRQR